MASAATDWANKRRAQILRAEQLRQQRKADLTEFTGQPTISKRPSYLGEAPKRQQPQQYGDSLDQIQQRYDPNDPMEAPLPGSKLQGSPAPAVQGMVQISPNSDALGTEMRRFPPNNMNPRPIPNQTISSASRILSSTRHTNSDFHGASLGDVLSSGRSSHAAPPITTPSSPSAFRSKFMQQYEQQTGQPYISAGAQIAAQPLVSKSVDPNPDDVFMQTLRSVSNAPNDSKNRATHGSSSSSSNKPSWNDDIASSSPFANGFGEPPAVRRLPPRKTAAAASAAGSATSGSTATSASSTRQRPSPRPRDDSNPMEQPLGPNRRRDSGGGTMSGENSTREWNADSAVNAGAFDRLDRFSHDRPAARGTPPTKLGRGERTTAHSAAGNASPRISPRREAPDDRNLGQQRSRLSLLKLKMRQSESGSGSRQSLAPSSSTPSVFEADGRPEDAPRTAPHQSRGYSDEYRDLKDREKARRAGPPPSSSRVHHQALMNTEDDETEFAKASNRAAIEKFQNKNKAGGGGRAVAKPAPASQWGEEEDYTYTIPEPAATYSRLSHHDDDDNRREDTYSDREKDRFMAVGGNGRGNDSESRRTGGQAKAGSDNGRGAATGQSRNTSSYAPAPQMPTEAPEPFGPIGDQLQCPDCGRSFNPVPYERHIKICAKVFQSKRKIFDSKKMRVADNPELVKILKQTAAKERTQKKQPSASAMGGKDAARMGGMGGGMPGGGFGGYGEPVAQPRRPDAKPKPQAVRIDDHNSQPANGGSAAKWKQDSNAFREAMKAARQVSKALATGAPLPPPTYSAPDPSMLPCPHCGRRFSQKAGERHIPQCSSIMAKPKVLKAHSGKAAVSGGAPPRDRRSVKF